MEHKFSTYFLVFAIFLVLAGSLVADEATTVNWNNITNIPAGFADGVDDVGTVETKEYANFYLNTGGVTGVAATETTLVINTEGEISNSSIFNLSSNTITVYKNATFLITADISFNTGGSSRSEYNVWLEKNTVDVPGTRTANYQRGYDSGSTSTFTTIVNVVEGDVFQLRTQRTDGGATTGYQDNEGTRISFIEI